MIAENLVIGARYNWKNQKERLVYHGIQCYSVWHEFALVDEPNKVWCEILVSDLHLIEETKEE